MIVSCNAMLAVCLLQVGINVEVDASTERFDASNRVGGELESAIPALREDAERQLHAKPPSKAGPERLVRRQPGKEQMHEFLRSHR